MGRPSSPVSAKQAYEQAGKVGYTLALIDPDKKMHSLAWDAIKDHANVQRSGSGKSIILVPADPETRRQPLVLKTKGMLTDSERQLIERAGFDFG
jgi:hypothetical protein